MHDIGKKEIPREILEKSKKELSEQARKIFETHSAKGAALLAQVPSIPSDIIEITQQHHENCLGTGFPTKLSKNRIHPLARVIAVASDFCNLVVKGPESPGIDVKLALQQMTSTNPKQYDEPVLQALVKLFKVLPSNQG